MATEHLRRPGHSELIAVKNGVHITGLATLGHTKVRTVGHHAKKSRRAKLNEAAAAAAAAAAEAEATADVSASGPKGGERPELLGEPAAAAAAPPSPGQACPASASQGPRLLGGASDEKPHRGDILQAGSDEVPSAVVERALQVMEIILSTEPPAPTGMPMQGVIIDFDRLLRFVDCHRRLCVLRGLEEARPRIVYHWTAEKNFASIIESGLRVPDGSQVSVAHGSAFGNGVYVSPDFNYAEEFFSYGARAAFMCLALPGRQHFGKPDMARLWQPDGFDSAAGRKEGRGVDEMIFFKSDQLLPIFLVDKLGLVFARDAAQAAVQVLAAPWPEETLGRQQPVKAIQDTTQDADVMEAMKEPIIAKDEGGLLGGGEEVGSAREGVREEDASTLKAASRWCRRGLLAEGSKKERTASRSADVQTTAEPEPCCTDVRASDPLQQLQPSRRWLRGPASTDGASHSAASAQIFQ